MLFGKKNKAYFVVREGEQRGKRISIKGTRASIGSSKRCDIRLEGDYVSELHLTIERKGSDWFLANNSPNGTYLNDKRVDNETLTHMGVLQIGADNTLVFHDGSPATEAAKTEEDTENDIEAGEKKTNWVLWGALVTLIYGPGSYFLYRYMTAEEGILASRVEHHTASNLEKSVEESRQYLMLLRATSSTEIPLPGKQVSTHSGTSENYYTLMSTGDKSKREQFVDSLLLEAKAYLLQGYLFYQSSRYRAALSEYRKAVKLVPDPRNPTTRFVLQGIQLIDKKTKKTKKSVF